MKHAVTPAALFVFLFFAIISMPGCTGPENIDLSGEWTFQTDPDDLGIAEKWYAKSLGDRIHLPGSMATNGKGYDVTMQTKWTGQVVDSSWFNEARYEKFRRPGNIKIPFWLQPDKHYVGAAWYQKTIEIPSGWKGKHISLYLERCHWETQVWVDDREAGKQNALGAPHVYDLTRLLSPGKHTITICVDNRVKNVDVGINAHSISDHTQTNWNGMIGKLELQSQPMMYIEDIRIYPDVAGKKITVEVTLGNITGGPVTGNLTLTASPVKGTGQKKSTIKSDIAVETERKQFTLEFPLGDELLLWDEFNPNLYRLEVAIKSEQQETDFREMKFGMREIATKGNQILINSKPVFFRGTLECAIFPKTGFPPTDTTEWMRIFRIARSYGINNLRFHSWCPPEAAFEAADIMGFYLQIESSVWNSTGDGLPLDKWIYEESDRIVNAFGNHPSFCMLLYGNESFGENSPAYLEEFCKYWKSKDNRRIYSSAAGFPIVSSNEFNSDPYPRIQGWGEGLSSIINSEPPRSDYDWKARIPADKPVISHEIGQWCAYPDFKEISQYNGILKARNFELFRETLNDNHMGHLADSFLMASGKLQVLCYKADIEAALRTPGFGGFQLLDLHDFPGQGTALIGVLNAFWQSKGYVTPEEYRRFCNTTVPLVRLPKMVYFWDEDLVASVEVAHFGENELNTTPSWKLTDQSQTTLASGKLPSVNIPAGSRMQLGEIRQPLGVRRAQKLTLWVSAGNFENCWDIWVYPPSLPEIKEPIHVTPNLDVKAMEILNQGGKVLLTLKKGSIKPDTGGDIAVGFSSIFWNTAWTSGQAPHTLGILCNPNHPALAEFPTEYHSNWQWWDAMSHANAILLTRFPPDIKPIVRIIDTWFENRPLALIIECKVGSGKLLISGADLLTGIQNRSEAQQLLYSLKKYMAGESFNPLTAVDKEILLSLLK